MSGRLGTDSRFLETLFSAGTASGLTDAQLLERFVSRHDETKEAAFESLVLRHRPMVFDICKQILDNTHDAQDAFQATFLILATRARSIMRHGSVGSWLHGVALRVARHARSDAARRNVQERRIAELKRWNIEPNTMDNGHDFEVLHDEVDRLPRKYREAVVLCYLEGMSLDAAAGQLGCPIGTLGVRLMRAKGRLKFRLTRRGMSVPSGILVAGSEAKSTSTALPATVIASTVNAIIQKSTSDIMSLAAARLTGDVLRSMVMIKLARTSAGFMVTLLALVFVGGLAAQSGMLRAGSSQNGKPKRAPADWIGRKVVTKYDALLIDENKIAVTDAFIHPYTVKEFAGVRAQLVFNDTNGWIKSSEIVLLDDAIDFYSSELTNTPNNIAAYFHRATIWIFLDQPENAIADFTAAIKLDPTKSLFYMNRGNVFRTKGDYDGAIADYTVAIRLDPKWADTYYQRGDAWYQKGSHDKAISDFTEAIRLGAKDGNAYRMRGTAWLNKKDYDKAIIDFTEAIRIDHNYVWAYLKRGEAWAWKKEYGKAIADYNEAIQIDPLNAVAFESRAFAWAQKHEYDNAIAEYTEAIRLDPNNSTAYACRGLQWIMKREYDQAIADSDEAIRLDPERAIAYNTRAWIWATCSDEKRRDGKKALESATRACELTKWNEPAYLETMAAGCAEEGDFDSAVKWQTRANELYADEDGRTAGKKRLELFEDKRPVRDDNL
jgi:RNA polymerase sigma factor (sigma-70 family)